jgi:hypothetical protein
MLRELGRAGLLMGLLFAGLATTASADYSSTVLGQAPIAYWRLNETTGGAATNLGSEGSLYDGEYFDGVLGVDGPDLLADGTELTGMGADNRAFMMEIADQYVTVIDSPLEGLSKFSMSGWIRSDLPQASRTGLWGQNDSFEFGIQPENTLNIWFPNVGGLSYQVPDDGIVDEAWYHVAVVGRGNALEFYLNGEQVAVNPDSSLPGSAGYGSSPYTFNIGGGGVYDPITGGTNGNGNQFTGTLDEIAMWDFALTAEQVESMWGEANKNGGNFSQAVLATNPLGYWPLNETDGTIAANFGAAGTALDGTYYAGSQGADGPSLPGMGANNSAYEVGPDFPTYVGVDAKPLNNRTQFSMGGWVRYEELFDNRTGLFGQNDVIEFGFINPTTIQIWAEGLTANNNLDYAHALDPDQWYHIVVTGDGEDFVLYINGEEVARGNSPLATEPAPYGTVNDFPFNIGGGGVWDATGNQFYGAMADIAIFDRALTPQQIKAQFDAALGIATLTGDYNANGQLDAGDLDLQASDGIANQNLAYDLNGDDKVDFDGDRVMWLHDLAKVPVGDADLSGSFTSDDFVTVFTAGLYETGAPATWGEGDWDGDLVFDSNDFVAAFIDGYYEQQDPFRGNGGVASVPEPSTVMLSLLGLIGLLRLTRRR